MGWQSRLGADNIPWGGVLDLAGLIHNSYLVRDEKTALIDTVWLPFAEEFVSNLKQTVDLNTIDYIIVNHAEIDHSGALPLLMKEIPDKPIYCTKNGIKSPPRPLSSGLKFRPRQDGRYYPAGQHELGLRRGPPCSIGPTPCSLT